MAAARTLTMVIFPALMSALITVGGGLPADEGGKLDFKIDLGDPPPCLTGFIPAPMIRTPADTTLRDLPTDLYCKTAQNDAAVVRGARNYPCMEFPGKRAPTVQLCRDPVGYVPIGTNPWRGPPIPYGTPYGQQEDDSYEPDSRTINPYNKFPFIPPEADYDPGPPVVQLPPGVPPGPGPAPRAPFPLPVPPSDPGGPPPIPLPYYAPPDQVVPPYGRQLPPPPAPGPLPGPEAPLLPAEGAPPQASAPATATYDSRTGVFVDPVGGIGVFAAGVDNATSAETWVDLMLDPRKV